MVVARSTSKGIFVFKITMEKKCTKCGEVKSLDEFSKDKRKKDGKQSRCKSCRKEYNKEYNRKCKKDDILTLKLIKLFYANHGLKKCTKCGEVKILDQFGKDNSQKDGKLFNCKICVNKRRREYFLNNREYFRKKSKKEYMNNKDYHKEYFKKYSAEKKEAIKELRKKNKDKLAERAKKYRQDNKKEIREYRNNYRKIRRLYDPLFILKDKIRCNIKTSITKKGYSKKTNTYKILKCEFSFFMNWLNGVASNGYTYGIGDLQLDHVIPMSLAKTEAEALLLNHYSNYQLLTATENQSKGNRYVNPVNLDRVLEHHPNPDKIREIHARL